MDTSQISKITIFSIIRKIFFRLLAPLIIITITILSSRSTLPETPSIPGMDKFLHFSAYAVLAAAIGLWFSGESWLKRPLRNFLICTAIASGYGVLDEVHQYFVPGRSSDIFDWIADILGSAAGSAVVLLGSRKFGYIGKINRDNDSKE